MKATRSLEYICFFPIEVPTHEGDAYLFMYVDEYSKFLIHTGTELKNDDKAVLKHLSLLMENKDFKKQSHRGFTLVLHKYSHLESEINEILHRQGGKFIIDDRRVTREFAPVM